jgi:hypothetical protein
MSTDKIVPIPDREFRVPMQIEAETLARTDPAKLTDLQLRRLICYDERGAYQARERRDQAKRQAAMPPSPAPAPVASQLPADIARQAIIPKSL